MFEFIRTHQRLMQFLLLVLIVPPFAFFGLDGYKRFSDDSGAVAIVGGHSITQAEFTQAQREQIERQREIARNLNVPFEAAMMDTPAARGVTLDNLVNQRALTTFAVKHAVAVTDERLREVIMAIPAVQEDGHFSKERYARLLAAQGYTPEAFENRLRQDLSLQALNAGIAETAFSPRTVRAMVARAQGEERDVQEYLVKAEAYVGAAKVTPEAVRSFYDANQKEFVMPAQIKVEYVSLGIDAIAQTLKAPSDEIKAFYDQNAARYRQEESRQASHILIKADEKSDRAAAKARAEDVLKQVRAPGADFGALAKKFSQDPGSAGQGGVLGSMTRGSMVKAFEDAVFTMKAGDISGIVDSEFGYHIIKLTGVVPAKVRTLDEVRPEIEKEWARREAQKRFTDSAEGFTNMVFEQADSLKPVADKYKLAIGTSAFFGRGAPPKELANPRLLERLFADDAIKARRNTEALEVAPGLLLSARVIESKPQTIKPFAEVEAQVREQLVRREAQSMARKEGEEKLKAAQQSADALAFGAPKTVSRTKPEGLPPEALRLVMSAPTGKLPSVVGAQVSGGYAIVRINMVREPKVVEPAREQAIMSALDRAQAESEFSAYLESVRQAAKVVVRRENLEKKGN